MTSIIALAAIMVLGVSSASAEPSKYSMPLEISGFIGGLPISDDSNRAALFDKVTVTLSEAASAYPNAQKAKLDTVINENGERYLTWFVIESSFDSTTHNGTRTIHVVDSVNITNTAVVTQQIDGQDKSQEKLDKIDEKIEKIENRQDYSGNPDRDGLKSQFLEIFKELRQAISDGDRDTVKDLREKLTEIRAQLSEMRG